jgi:tRNA 2-selenouridine synthase
MPDQFWFNMQTAPTLVLVMEIEKRLPRLIAEYSTYPHEVLKESIIRISKRLGGDNTRDAIKALNEGDFSKAIEIVLRYYDKAYQFGLGRKPSKNIVFLKTDSDDIEYNANIVLEASAKISW